MKIIELNSGLLSNHEVAQVLKDRGAEPTAGLNTRATASEKTVYEYLASHSAELKDRSQLAALLDDLKPFALTRAELVQVVNLAPGSAVEVHLIVEDCDQRLNEEQVQQLLEAVARHLGPAGGGGGGALAAGGEQMEH